MYLYSDAICKTLSYKYLSGGQQPMECTRAGGRAVIPCYARFNPLIPGIQEGEVVRFGGEGYNDQRSRENTGT